MAVELNHTIVFAHDNRESAGFLAKVLDLPIGDTVGPFVQLDLANGVRLDFMSLPEFGPQHYAFLVDDDVFDAACERLRAAGVQTYADPAHQEPDQVNDECGGRGIYFSDPAGHNMELLTRAS